MSDALERARALRAKLAPPEVPEQPQPPAPPQFRPDLIPQVDSERSEEDKELDRVLDGVDILTAYSRWCGKMTPDSKGKTEGIMISCPTPEHADKNPSAWINTDKQTWFCGGCQEGGDKYDIAAYAHGYPVPGYKEGAMFHKLRRSMAEDLGYTFNVRAGGGHELVAPIVVDETPQQPPRLQLAPPVAPEVVPPPAPMVPAPGEPYYVEAPPPPPPPQVVRSIDPVSDAFDPDLDSDRRLPGVAWRVILKDYSDTFLYQWLKATTADYGTEEYHLFNGLQMVGLVAGRNVQMGGGRHVLANLSICLLGRTGSGKSSAQGYMRDSLRRVVPEQSIGLTSEGVKLVGEVASGESLIGSFERTVEVSSSFPLQYIPVVGLVEFDELSTILAKSSITGSTLKNRIMQFIDGHDTITNVSQTHKVKKAVSGFAAFTTGSQPKALRKLIDNQDLVGGYLNRWIYVAGPSKPQQDFVGTVPIDFTHPNAKLKELADWCKKKPSDPPRILEWDPDTYVEFNEWFGPINELIKSSDNDMLARLILHYKKIMLCFAINRMATSIGEPELKFIQALHDWLIFNYKLVGAEVGRTVGQEITDRVFSYIKRKEQTVNGEVLGPTRVELRRALHTKNITDKQLNEAVDTLIRGGLLEELKVNTNKRGRPSTRLRRVAQDD